MDTRKRDPARTAPRGANSRQGQHFSAHDRAIGPEPPCEAATRLNAENKDLKHQLVLHRYKRSAAEYELALALSDCRSLRWLARTEPEAELADDILAVLEPLLEPTNRTVLRFCSN